MVTQLRLDAEARRVVDVLAAKGVDALVLKGAHTARRLHDRGGMASGDIDLVVAPERFALAAATLSLEGFSSDEYWAPPGAEAVLYRRDDVYVDLHRRIAGFDAPPGTTWDELWRRSQPMRLGGGTVRVLDDAGLALHVAVHAAHHGPDHPKPVADLRAALVQLPRPTWVAAAALAGTVMGGAAMRAGLDLVGRVDLADSLGLPSDVPLAVRAEAAGATPPTVELARLLQLARDHRGLALARALSRLFVRAFAPPPALLRARWPFARTRPGLVVAYVWRPIAAAADLVRAVAGLRRLGPRR